MNILIKPIITEKMTGLTEKMNLYGFVVSSDANKIQIKQAVEKAYGVNVENVRTMKYIGKVKARNTRGGVKYGITGRCKKAIVSLAKGETIDFYSSI
ncbi:MAG: 50S ribosomal protein L23 [Bacteroidia bacterium]|jgi:large subunit ribosomal protein L23|nr:50S ribosomal protein L23 [Bacteroidia bacterium]MCC6769235.1 50S ribosomal protein L23 [Bacteroidia bacterium]